MGLGGEFRIGVDAVMAKMLVSAKKVEYVFFILEQTPRRTENVLRVH